MLSEISHVISLSVVFVSSFVLFLAVLVTLSVTYLEVRDCTISDIVTL